MKPSVVESLRVLNNFGWNKKVQVDEGRINAAIREQSVDKVSDARGRITRGEIIEKEVPPAIREMMLTQDNVVSKKGGVLEARRAERRLKNHYKEENRAKWGSLVGEMKLKETEMSLRHRGGRKDWRLNSGILTTQWGERKSFREEVKTAFKEQSIVDIYVRGNRENQAKARQAQRAEVPKTTSAPKLPEYELELYSSPSTS